MKKYIIILFLIVPIVSCNDFLEEKQVSTLTQDYYNTESGLDGLINGLYVYARVKHEWDVNGSRLVNAETDAYMTADPNWARFTSANYGTDESAVAGNINNFIGSANSNYAPMGAYPHINNCNIALEQIENVAPGRYGTSEEYAARRKAEVLFLRAWAYYLISNQLGDVPLLLESKRQDDGVYYYPKSSLEEVYNQIISDVRFAYDNLPADPEEWGQATKWAAGHFLAKLYLNRAQAAEFENSSEAHLQMLYKGSASTDLDSVITIATEVINGISATSSTNEDGLAPDYWTLFNPDVSETSPSREVLWSAQFDLNTSLNGRFGGNRSVNYHTGDYTNQTGVTRAMAYGRPFARFKPTDWGYDNFKNKLHDSRYYKTFQPEYISNMSLGNTSSYRWTDESAAWWNAHKPADAPEIVKVGGEWPVRILPGTRALIYLENQKDEALDSAMVMSMPFQFMVRWVQSAETEKYYYRLFIDGTNMGLNTGRTAPYLASNKHVDPRRGGSPDESNFNSEAGTRDGILMRLGETYLIRAEAYGRLGQYSDAVEDINTLRRRAAYKAGENRHPVAVEWEPGAASLPAEELEAPYVVSANTFAEIEVTEDHFTPGTPEADAEDYVPSADTKEEMFIHFIYNEMARELLSEGVLWEAQHNAGILYERLVYHNQLASNQTGLWPEAENTANGNGQDGNGKGLVQPHHTFRPWPNAYLSLLTDENGSPLDEEARRNYQNPGYRIE